MGTLWPSNKCLGYIVLQKCLSNIGAPVCLNTSYQRVPVQLVVAFLFVPDVLIARPRQLFTAAQCRRERAVDKARSRELPAEMHSAPYGWRRAKCDLHRAPLSLFCLSSRSPFHRKMVCTANDAFDPEYRNERFAELGRVPTPALNDSACCSSSRYFPVLLDSRVVSSFSLSRK